MKKKVKETHNFKKECEEKNDTIYNRRMCIIQNELQAGYEKMKKYSHSVTIFGSARLPKETEMFKKTENLAKKIADSGYSVVTGGGGGIMEAANKGAFESKQSNSASVGLNIKLPMEQEINSYVNDSIYFEHFFSRKVILAYLAEAYIFCPGGFGTLDELFEILTLKQNEKIDTIPIILYGSYFWNPLENFFKKVLFSEQKMISKEDLNLYKITDDDDQILHIIKSSPLRAE